MAKALKQTEFFDGIAGGPLAPERVRTDLTAPSGLVAQSELDKKIARLLVLHPDLRIKFRNNDLAKLDDNTKRLLLQDMRDVLNIPAPLYEEDNC